MLNGVRVCVCMQVRSEEKMRVQAFTEKRFKNAQSF